jgi:hypothetical protein
VTSKGILELRKNPRLVQSTLLPIVGKKAASKIEVDLQKHARGLFRLGRSHLRFAKSIRTQDWRQIVSRAYYAAYNMSRSVRLFVKGEYSDDSKDHQNFGLLPDNFPSQATYVNKLGLLRDDRNISDYDHNAKVGDLSITPSDAVRLADDFAKDAARYLASNKFQI